MASTMHQPPLHEGITGGIVVDGVGVGTAICVMYLFYRLVQVRQIRPRSEASQLGKHIIPVTGMNRLISISVEDDGWDNPGMSPGR